MGGKRKELPPGFRELFPVMKNRELAEKFGVSKKLIEAWGRKAGLKKTYPTNLYGNNYKRVLQTVCSVTCMNCVPTSGGQPHVI